MRQNDFQIGEAWLLKSGISSGNNRETNCFMKKWGSVPFLPRFQRPWKGFFVGKFCSREVFLGKFSLSIHPKIFFSFALDYKNTLSISLQFFLIL